MGVGRWLALFLLACSCCCRVQGDALSGVTRQQDPRATTYVLESVFFQLSTIDTKGANINIAFKDANGNVLNSALLLVHKTIQEVDPITKIPIVAYDNPTGWVYTQGNTTDSATGGLIAWGKVEGTFPNGASLVYTFMTNEKTRLVSFAGESFNLSAGAFKFQVDVNNWPFANRTNLLQIILENLFTNLALKSFDSSGNTTNILLAAVYPGGPDYAFNFRESCLLDNEVSKVSGRGRLQSADPLILNYTFTFQHANFSIQYDPDLGAVFGSSANGDGGGDGGDGSTTLALAIAIPVGVSFIVLLSLVIIVGVSVFLYLRKKAIKASIQKRVQSAD